MDERKLRELVEDYRPNQEVLKQLNKISFLAIVGTTSSGKTSLIRMLARSLPDFKHMLTETSRQKRQDEQETRDYFFVSKDKIIDEIKKGSLVQVALSPTGELYASRIEDYPAGGTGVAAILSNSIEAFRAIPFKRFQIAFIVPKSYEEWMSWLDKRPMDGREKAKRLEEAKDSYKFALSDRKTNFILNDTIEKALKRVVQVCSGQEPDNEEEARVIAEDNYAKLVAQLENKVS